MSEAQTAVLNNTLPANLPLSVMLFHAAMTQDISLSEFADQLGIGALSLRQFISGQTQRPRSKTLDLLAQALDISVEEARRRTTLRPIAAPPFADWLKTQMNGRFSRAKLTRETRISDGALRNYLSGQTLPDSDQAQRLSEALNVPPLEVAQVIIADQTVRSGGETIPLEAVATPTTSPVISAPPALPEPQTAAVSVSGDDYTPAPQPTRTQRVTTSVRDEDHLLNLWRQLHPQGRRATLIYIAGLLAEE